MPTQKPPPKLPKPQMPDTKVYTLPPRSTWQWSQLHQIARGDGTTTKQIKDAPAHSYYICLNHPTILHSRRLASQLLRYDLKFVHRETILNRIFRPLLVPGIVVDHAVNLSYEELIELSLIRIQPV